MEPTEKLINTIRIQVEAIKKAILKIIISLLIILIVPPTIYACGFLFDNIEMLSILYIVMAIFCAIAFLLVLFACVDIKNVLSRTIVSLKFYNKKK